MPSINPIQILGKDLLLIQNPVRYLGGEYGQIIKDTSDLTVALVFPDLYEIAMSNLAIKILYRGLNAIPSVKCERVFAPAPDFEDLLDKSKIPLYTLETGIPLHETDVIAVTIGYEPGITALISILHSGGVPIDCDDRSTNDAIVIAGGCGITNPVPFAKFVDVFFIGEAEAGFFELIEKISIHKKSGASRSTLLEIFEAHPSVWTKRKNAQRNHGLPCARKAIYSDFGMSSDSAACFPVPNMRIVQDHGIVEIMRGCPNGCRFCHAGNYYRPQRMMNLERILSDVDFLVNRGGYREISLMSLSSGDYEGIDLLLDILGSKYSHQNVSFQLPSLKVNSFTLPLLEKLAEVRKSGLTFAVETPVDAWQLSLNKEVYRDKIISIMLEAKKRGWNKAKFYFMIGLPVFGNGQSEEEEIVNFLLDIQERTRLSCNVNVGTFIPKPHTAYQWSAQLSVNDAEKKLDYIHRNLPKGKFKVSTHRPFNSLLEAIISRGDERAGDFALEGWKKGCRLDAWEDWAKPEIWKEVIKEAPWDVEQVTNRERKFDEDLPWDGVSLGVSKSYLKKEMERSNLQELSPRCDSPCIEPCGVCNSSITVVHTDSEQLMNAIPEKVINIDKVEKNRLEPDYRVVMSFSKKDQAAFIPHLGLLEIWHKAFQRSKLQISFTEGFNPMPRFEIAQSLSLGISSDEEIASFLMFDNIFTNDQIQKLLNESLPNNIRVTKVFVYKVSRKIKRDSLSKYLWGNTYKYSFYSQEDFKVVKSNKVIIEFLKENQQIHSVDSLDGNCLEVTIPFSLDRTFRDLIAQVCEKSIYEIMSIHKKVSLAKLLDSSDDTPKSFFTIFETVAEQSFIAQRDL